MNEYNALIAALRILDSAEKAINAEDDVMITPAYSMVKSAQRHVRQLAERALRGE